MSLSRLTSQGAEWQDKVDTSVKGINNHEDEINEILAKGLSMDGSEDDIKKAEVLKELQSKAAETSAFVDAAKLQKSLVSQWLGSQAADSKS